MKAVKTIALGAAGIVALVGASAPAAAQYFPCYGYNNPGNVIGQVLNSVLNPYGGYGQYGYNQYGYGYGGNNPQAAASQCTAAVQQQLQGRYAGGYGYGQYGYSNARVLGVTRIEPRSSGLRVRGDATSGMAYGGYGYGRTSADLTFRCDVDYRGYIRDVDIDRRY